MLPRLDVCVRLSPDVVALTVPRFGVTASHPALIAVIRRPDGSLTVFAVGREARDLPDAGTDQGLPWRRAPAESVLWRDASPDAPPDPSAPCLVAVANPLREGRRGLELLEAMLVYHRVATLGALPWWARAFASVRVSVSTEGVARDEATLDTIAVACGSPDLAVTIDGHPWHGPSPHSFDPPRGWRDRVGVALVLAIGAAVIWHPAARWVRELFVHERALHAAACVLVLQGAHAAWWHARQQRRRASQRARLSAAAPHARP